MFFTLILENENGEQLDMTTTANQYMTSKIEGLSPPAGTINTSAYAGINGSYLNRAFLEKRNVVISYRMKGVDIESRRHALYRVVKTAHYIKVYYRTRKISVYARTFTGTVWRSRSPNTGTSPERSSFRSPSTAGACRWGTITAPGICVYKTRGTRSG